MTRRASADDRAFLIDLPSNGDDRGVLTSVEAINDIPIEIRRVFYMHHMVQDRGGHSHTDTDQVVIAAHGSLSLQLTYPDQTTCQYTMNDPCKGLYIPRLTFVEIGEITPDAVCLVLANTVYDMSKSLRNFEQYLDYIKHLHNQGKS